MIKSISKQWNKISIPNYNGKTGMIPFELSDLNTLPSEFRQTVREMIKNLPNKIGEAFITVHGEFVKQSNTLRRGAPHIDGNYIKQLCSWGSGGGNGWKVEENGVVLSSKDHLLSYENPNGGMIIASNYSACMGWNGEFEGSANVGGDCSHIDLNDGFMLKANTAYYGNSQFIHESLPLDKDVHRVMYRITLPIDHSPLIN